MTARTHDGNGTGAFFFYACSVRTSERKLRDIGNSVNARARSTPNGKAAAPPLDLVRYDSKKQREIPCILSSLSL
jgi:hypothetical protein